MLIALEETLDGFSVEFVVIVNKIRKWKIGAEIYFLPTPGLYNLSNYFLKMSAGRLVRLYEQSIELFALK